LKTKKNKERTRKWEKDETNQKEKRRSPKRKRIRRKKATNGQTFGYCILFLNPLEKFFGWLFTSEDKEK